VNLCKQKSFIYFWNYNHFTNKNSILLAPYLIVFYWIRIHGLLLYGDQFLFEDGIGRMKRLPCAQFQHWNVSHSYSKMYTETYINIEQGVLRVSSQQLPRCSRILVRPQSAISGHEWIQQLSHHSGSLASCYST
jgi:hypothetical protein